MPIYSFEGKTPCISPEAFVHPTAVIIGRVTIGDNCFIGPGAVLRGDWGEIIVEEGSNVQDNAVIHVRPEETCYLGANSHVGHGAILHGCRLEGHVLVGMGAVINDGVLLREGCLVASGSVVLSGVQVDRRTMVAGIPATPKGEVDDAKDALMWMGHKFYQSLPPRYRDSSEEVTLEEAQRKYQAGPGHRPE
jgi:phenylacetic acid degradation protein